ncbi:MAG: hypothetical protein QG646_1139 [Euryarchaeota archaeon]|nr:hypothetical protein [Euryarchaeota archaeon]
MVKIVYVLICLFLLCNRASASDYSATDAGADMVAKGIQKALIIAADSMYGAFNNNTDINEKFSTPQGALFNFSTQIPDPYNTPEVKKLSKNYRYLAIFFVILFILGEFMNRNLARMKVTESVFGSKDLSTSRFVGGITMCFIGLFANFIFIGALKVTEVLSQYAMFGVMDSIAPSPDNVVTYLGMAICDFCIMIFFIIRYYIIVAAAIVCTVIAVLWVPETTREFAQKTTEMIVRVLALQPAAVFATSVGILGLKNMPAIAQPLGYICLTIFVILTCWYFLFGDFKIIKKGGKILIKAGGIS